MASSVIKKESHFITLFHNKNGLSLPATGIPLNYNRDNFRWLIITIGQPTNILKRATFLVTGARNNNYCSVKINSSEEWAIQDVYAGNGAIMNLNVNIGNNLSLFDVVGIV